MTCWVYRANINHKLWSGRQPGLTELSPPKTETEMVFSLLQTRSYEPRSYHQPSRQDQTDGFQTLDLPCVRIRFRSSVHILSKLVKATGPVPKKNEPHNVPGKQVREREGGGVEGRRRRDCWGRRRARVVCPKPETRKPKAETQNPDRVQVAGSRVQSRCLKVQFLEPSGGGNACSHGACAASPPRDHHPDVKTRSMVFRPFDLP